MNKIVFCLVVIVSSIFGVTVKDIFTTTELNSLKLKYTDDEIIKIAKQRLKSGIDLNKIKDMNNAITSDEKNFNEYCFDNISVSDAKGKSHYLDICLASSNTYNKFVLADMIVSLISIRSSEELLTIGGQALLKAELQDNLKSKVPVYFSKFTIKQKVCK